MTSNQDCTLAESLSAVDGDPIVIERINTSYNVRGLNEVMFIQIVFNIMYPKP